MTDAASEFVVTFIGIPAMTGGLTFQSQAYAVDFSAMFPEQVLVSNRVVTTLP